MFKEFCGFRSQQGVYPFGRRVTGWWSQGASRCGSVVVTELSLVTQLWSLWKPIQRHTPDGCSLMNTHDPSVESVLPNKAEENTLPEDSTNTFLLRLWLQSHFEETHHGCVTHTAQNQGGHPTLRRQTLPLSRTIRGFPSVAPRNTCSKPGLQPVSHI